MTDEKVIIDKVLPELDKFFKVELVKCREALQKYIDEEVRRTEDYFRKFLKQIINEINQQKDACVDRILAAYNTSKYVEDSKPFIQKQLSLFDPEKNIEDKLTQSEKKKLRALWLLNEKKKIFEVAKDSLPDVCTKETIIRAKLSHNKEIREAILKNDLVVYQKYGEGKRSSFLLFRKEDVLNWVSKKWGI